MNRKLRPFVDTLMLVGLLALVSFPYLGPAVHEGLGLGVFAIVASHLGLTLGRRRWRLLGPIEVLLAVDLLLMAITGLSLARNLVTLPFPLVAPSMARPLHRILAHAAVVLVGVHIGLRLRFKTSVWINVVLAGVALYGFLAAFRRGFFQIDLGRNLMSFSNPEEPLVGFLLDHIAIFIAALTVGALVRRLPAKETTP